MSDRIRIYYQVSLPCSSSPFLGLGSFTKVSKSYTYTFCGYLWWCFQLSELLGRPGAEVDGKLKVLCRAIGWTITKSVTVMKLSRGLPSASHPCKGRDDIIHLCFLGLQPSTWHIIRAEEACVDGLINLHRNGFLFVLIKARAKRPFWPPGRIHATNYWDIQSWILRYLRQFWKGNCSRFGRESGFGFPA